MRFILEELLRYWPIVVAAGTAIVYLVRGMYRSHQERKDVMERLAKLEEVVQVHVAACNQVPKQHILDQLQHVREVFETEMNGVRAQMDQLVALLRPTER